jgi:glycosyltransferase involved in cell wall biosynthesis
MLIHRMAGNSPCLSPQSSISVLMFDAAYPLPVIGGKEKQAYLLANELVTAKEVNIGVLTFEFITNHNDSQAVLDVCRLEKKRFYSIRLLTNLIRLRKQYKILHIHTPSRVGKFVAILGKILSYKVFFKIPNEGTVSTAGVSRYVDHFFFRFILTKAIILERSTWEELKKYDYLHSKLIHIPNGVEVREQKHYRFSDKSINVLFVGRLVQQKGCDKLIKALSLLAKEHIKFKVTIVGDGPELSSLKNLAIELDVDKHISFVGNKEDVLSYMYRSDVLINTSDKEGMSNVLLEAMSVGLPIIATQVGALKQQLGDYYQEYGCCVESAAVEVSDRIKDLYKNNSQLEEYGAYLYKRSNEKFSISQTAKVYLDEYKKVLNKC